MKDTWRMELKQVEVKLRKGFEGWRSPIGKQEAIKSLLFSPFKCEQQHDGICALT